MSATILSLETPFFTRLNDDGTFTISNLPPGQYKMEVYHPLLKTNVSNFELVDGQNYEVSLDLTNVNP